MKTERVTIYTTDGQIIDGVKRHWPDHVDHADLCGNRIPEDNIAEVRAAWMEGSNAGWKAARGEE